MDSNTYDIDVHHAVATIKSELLTQQHDSDTIAQNGYPS